MREGGSFEMTNQAWAAVVVALLALFLLGVYCLPGVGSYPVENRELHLKASAGERGVVDRSAALGPLVPRMRDRRPFNPFSLQRELHREEIGDLELPPPPPLASPEPPVMPLPPSREEEE